MILLIPSIDLSGGHCARCIVGEPGTENMYHQISDHPFELARLWRRENAKSLHITDLDGMAGRDNTANCETILEIVRSVDIPIELLTNFHSIEECRFWLERGIYRVIINELIYTNPEDVRALIEEFTPSKVIVGIRAKDGQVVFPSLEKDVTDTEYALFAKSLGIKRLVYSDISWEGSLSGPDFEMLRRIARESGLRVTEAGGISSPQQLWKVQELQRDGVDSAIVGRALYENRFPCQKIWRQVEAELEPEIVQREM